MEVFFLWQIKSAVYLLAFYLVYIFFLRNETFFGKNRAYLLISTLMAFVLPFITIPAPDFMLQANLGKYLINSVSNYQTSAYSPISDKFTITSILGVIYLMVMSYFIIRLAIQTIMILRIADINHSLPYKDCRIVYVDENISPFSFFRIIFINPKDYTDTEFQRILMHERVHVNQLHTLDIIIMEILIAIQWFIPVLRLYRKALIDVHEYLADRGVISKGISKKDYGNLILKEVVENRNYYLANNFSASLIKNRISMLSSRSSAKTAGLKMLVALPLMALILTVFSAMQNNSSLASKPEEKNMPYTNTTITMVKSEDEYLNLNHEPRVNKNEIVKHIKYPIAAKRARLQGIVTINALVSETGFPIQMKVKNSSHRVFNSSALKAIKCVRFTPAQQDGKNIKAWVSIPIQFTLQGVS